MKNKFHKVLFGGLLMAASLFPGSARADYPNFPDVKSGSDICVQELRWPYWNGAYYNTWVMQSFTSVEGTSGSFYSGVPLPSAGSPAQAGINYSFWSLSNPLHPTDTVSSKYSSPTTFPRQTIAEGTILEDPGTWYFWQTNTWYRVAFRAWQPADGTPHLGYAGEWVRDGASGIWYHTATVQTPFSITGVSGWGGFQEDAAGSSSPQRTDYRRLYYHYNGVWNSATNFFDQNQNISVSYLGDPGMVDNAALITNSVDGTNAAVYVETCNHNTNYVGTVANGARSPTFSMSQPATPTFFDPILVTNYSGSVTGGQLLVQWQILNTSSPQFAYQINVYTNAGYTGTVVATFYDNDPEVRQKLLNIPTGVTPYPQLTIVDIFNQTNAPVNVTVTNAVLLASTNVSGVVGGLNFAYYESASNIALQTSGTNWSSMPNFPSLTPALQGAVSGLDLTPRRRRDGYAFNYTGYINVPSNGLYAFTLNSCDGSKLYVDGQLVVNNDGEHSPADLSSWVGLQAGYHTLNVQYFCDTQPYFGYYFDSISLSYEGPGITKTAVPVTAYSRVPGGSEPTISLTSPTNGVTISGAGVPLSAAVTANGNTINSVWFYNGNNYWAQDTSAPYSTSSLFWDSNTNQIHARLYYNSTNIIDSPVNLVTTTNQTLAPWQFGQVFFHDYPSGASIQSGTYSMIGDGVDLLTRQVSGDCTIIAHLAGLPSTAAAPDGSVAESGWQAGIILRGTTNLVQGYPWGKSGNAPFVAVFGKVGGGTYYQDEDMVNGGGGYNRGVTSGNWFKLVRTGGTNFTSFVSPDGSTWTQVGNTNLTDFPTTIYAGMFTYAEPDGNLSVPWAKFDNVSILGNILGPPTVSVTPSSATAYTGQTTTFTAQPGGNAPFYYQWQLNGVNLTGATNAALTLTNLQPANSGIYNVVLTNADGTASATATLSVQTLASMTTQVLLPLGDAYVYDGSPTGNYGTQTNLFVKTNSSAGYSRNAYLMFNVNGLTNVQSAQLQLMPVSTQYTLNVDFQLITNDTWTELGITWANQPTEAGTDITNMPGFTVGLPVLANVTSQVISKAGQDGLLSIRLLSTSPGSGQVMFGSRESALVTNQPQLIYTLNSPGVSLTSPASGAAFGAPGTINLAASGVNISGHTINYVQFYNGATLLGVSSNAPYSLAWTNAPVGQYTVYALAVYDVTNTMSSVPAFITVNPLPSAPATISPVALSGNLVNVSWPAATNASGYVLSRNGTAIAWLAGTNYADLGLAANTTYSYFVVATNQWGSSAPSVTNSATTFGSGGAYWWDAGGASAGAQDGNGNWGGSATNWWNGSANVAWTDNNLAIFGNGTTTNCTVTITNNVTPGGILFNANSGGTYTLSSSGSSLVVLSGTPAITCNDSATINAVLQGSSGFSKTGPGTLTLTGTNTYTGATTIGSGVLTVGSSGRLGSGSYAGNIADNSALNYNSTLAQTLSGVISGTGSLAQQGAGALTLSGANTYSGGTTVVPNGDVVGLVAASASALGTGSVLVNGGQHYSYSLTVNTGLTVTNALTLKPGAGGTGNAYLGLANSSVWSGPVTVDNSLANGVAYIASSASAGNPSIVSGTIGYSTLAPGVSLGFRGSGGYQKVTGPVSLSTGEIQLVDTSKVEFSNGANTWGQLDAGNSGAIIYVGAANTLSSSGIVSSSSGGTFQMNNMAGTAAYNQTIAGLSGNIKVALATGSATLTLNVLANQFQTNAISGALALVKTGTATQTLAGTNTYTGTTTINAGTLVMGPTGSIATSPSVVIASNATFDVSALATFAFTGSSPVQTLAGGSPSGTANLTATGRTVTLNSGAQLSFQAGSNTVGKLSVAGNLTLNANAVTVNVSGAALAPGTYRLLDCTGTLANTGTFGTPVFTGIPLVGATAAISVTPGAAGHIDLVVQANTYTLTYNAGANGNISGTSPQTVNYGASGTAVSAVPNSGYVFTNWSDGLAVNPRTDVNVTNNISVTANFVVTAPVVVPPVVPVITNVNIALDRTSFTVAGLGGTNENYVLWGATNLPPAWMPLLTNLTDANGVFRFIDFQMTNYLQRFYRVQSQP